MQDPTSQGRCCAKSGHAIARVLKFNMGLTFFRSIGYHRAVKPNGIKGLALTQLLSVLPRNKVSGWVGQAASWSKGGALTAQVIERYKKFYGIDMDDYVEPVGGFPTFNDFFTRALKPGKRPIATADVVSPADGELSTVSAITSSSTLNIKGTTYGVEELMMGSNPITPSPHEASEWNEGTAMVVYLSPRDYHRVHVPVHGDLAHIGYIPGDMFPVNDLGFEMSDKLFSVNERVTVFQETPWGPVATVFVAAFIVGGISLKVWPELRSKVLAGGKTVWTGATSQTLNKGDELGMFHLGSTVVLFLPKGFKPTVKEGTVRMGQGLATCQVATIMP